MPDLTALLLEPELPASVLALGLCVATLVSEDAACILAANAVADDRLSFAAAVSACFAGIFLGDLALYGIGRMVGEAIFRTRVAKRFLGTERVTQARAWFDRSPGTTIFSSRFVTGFRLPTYLLAGAVKADARKFALYLAAAGALWTPTLIATVAWSQRSFFTRNALIGVVASFSIINLIMRYSRWENRRMLIGRLRRIQKWEFWPLQIFYIPVVAYIFWLGVKYRSFSVFTAANPGLPAGGFKGESKHDIYRHLESASGAQTSILAHTLLPVEISSEERISKAKDFMWQRGLIFPIVIKPDAGERGRGVTIIRNLHELESVIFASSVDQILQEFVKGVEVGVFYVRKPGVTRGRIFSITEKHFPVVIGNGRSTVKELILANKRAVCLASSYLAYNELRSLDVPSDGESVKLIDIGTHSRGAIFLDGGWLTTPKLGDRIDEICRSLPEFYFGRLDLRAASFDDLEAGRFKVIEINGVTSESTNIYDPRYSLFDAYQILFRQWRVAFEIGATNRARGAFVTSVTDLLRLGIFGKQLQASNFTSGLLTDDL